MECTANFCSQRSRFFVCSFRSHAPNRVTTQSPNAAVINANIIAINKYDSPSTAILATLQQTPSSTPRHRRKRILPTTRRQGAVADNAEQHHRCRHDPALAMKTSATKTPATKTGKTASHLRKARQGITLSLRLVL
jgi:G3E family GTPase